MYRESEGCPICTEYEVQNKDRNELFKKKEKDAENHAVNEVKKKKKKKRKETRIVFLVAGETSHK